MLKISDFSNQTNFISQPTNADETTITDPSENTLSNNLTTPQEPIAQEQETSKEADVKLPNIKAKEQALMTNMFRQSLQGKVPSTSVNSSFKGLEKSTNELSKNEPTSNVGTTLGAAVGEKNATRQTQTAMQTYDYPQRSEQSDKAASAMESAMKEAGFGKDIGKAIGAGLDKNGSIILSASGDINTYPPERYFTILSNGKLQEKLNTAFANDPTVKKTDGNVKFEVKLEKISTRDLYTSEYSQPATEVLKQAMKEAGLPEARLTSLDRFVVAGVRNGQVVIGSTNGNLKLSKAEYYDIISKGKLQQKLDTVFANDSTVSKTSNVVFELAPAKIKNLDLNRNFTYLDPQIDQDKIIKDLHKIQPNAENLKDVILKNPIESVKTIYENTQIFSKYRKEDRVCAEDRLFQGQDTEKLTSMTVASRTDLPRGAKAEKSEYVERLDNPDGKIMVACPSCKENSEVIITGNMDNAEAIKWKLNKELGSAGKSAAAGGVAAGSTYVVEQFLKEKPVDSKVLLGNTLVGAGSGAVAGKIEETVTKKALLAAGSELSEIKRFGLQLGGAGTARAIVGAGSAAINEYQDYQSGKISKEKYAKDIAKEGGIGLVSSLAGATAGAYFGGIVGSAVPVAGTAVGIVAGGIVGYIADKTLRAAAEEISEQTIEKITVPMSVFKEGVSVKVPVYPKDTQFDVMIRSFGMTAKGAGLGKADVEQVMDNWSAKYRQVQGDIRFTHPVDGQPVPISDQAFEQYKQQGFLVIRISAASHGPVLKDIQNRLEKSANTTQQ